MSSVCGKGSEGALAPCKLISDYNFGQFRGSTWELTAQRATKCWFQLPAFPLSSLSMSNMKEGRRWLSYFAAHLEFWGNFSGYFSASLKLTGDELASQLKGKTSTIFKIIRNWVSNSVLPLPNTRTLVMLLNLSKSPFPNLYKKDKTG